MPDSVLECAIRTVPPGGWAIGVSGGADSVALLLLLGTRPDLSLHVAHLDHQTRGQASAQDAAFVEELARRLGLPCTMRVRSEIEVRIRSLPSNVSARYRAARLEFFRQVVAAERLQGVLLGHHADDQAETVLHRLLRGSGPSGLAGMSPRTCIDGLVILRPLLAVRRSQLRSYLDEFGQDWREDASNESSQYLRNRLRKWLAAEPALHGTLLALSESCRSLRHWLGRAAPVLPETFTTELLHRLPDILAHESARRWLIARGAPASELSEQVLGRLIALATDAATPPRQQFPGGMHVRRRGGVIFSES